MPISTTHTFHCNKCGYTTVKTIGDVLNPADFICPKCGGFMEIDYNKESKGRRSNLLQKVLEASRKDPIEDGAISDV